MRRGNEMGLFDIVSCDRKRGRHLLCPRPPELGLARVQHFKLAEVG